MKLVMFVVAVVTILSLMIVGSSPKPAALAAEETPSEQEPPPGAPEVEVIEWVGQSYLPAGYFMFESLQTVCDRITTASGERLGLTVEPASELCPPGEEFDGVHEGDIDFAVSPFLMWTDKFPAAGLFTTRAGGMSPTEKYSWFISGGGAELAEEMIAGYNVQLIPGGGQLEPAEIFLHSNAPINKPGDLEGLKIRAVGDAVEILSRMGAVIVIMPSEAIHESMEREVINAFEYSTATLNWTMSFQEIADYVYVSECRWPHTFNPFLVNKTRWDELPDDLKIIVEDVNKVEAISYYSELKASDIEHLQMFRDYGCVVQPLSGEVEQAFVEVANEYYDEEAAVNPFFAEVLESQRDFQGDNPSPDVAEGLGSISDKLKVVYSFHDGYWTWYNPSWPPSANTLTTLYMGRGYWINVSHGCDLTYGANTYHLDEGWNLIGWLGW